MIRSYDEYLRKLTEVCKKKSLCLETIGSHDGFELKIVRVNQLFQDSICIIGGIHGDEIGGPHGILHWLENSSFQFNKSLDILPIVNPYGYVHSQRKNKDYDMNRQWIDSDNLKDENLIVYNAIKDRNYQLMFTAHEDTDQQDGFYLYASQRSRTLFWNKCVDLAGKRFKIYDKDTVWGDPIVSGIGWHDCLVRNKDSKCIETWFYENKCVPYLTTEPSDVYPLKDREEFFAELIDLVCKEY